MSIKVLYEGTGEDGSLEPKVDIVAVHGLNPWNTADHAVKTWESKSGHLWLRDAFPLDVPDARTMLYAYGSSPAIGTEKDRFIYQANSLLECLRLRRRKDPTRPLIMVGHSLGGILIKQALVNAHANPLYKPIIDATFGLVFFGTPHAGPTQDSKVQFGKACVSIFQSLPGNQSNDTMEALKNGSLYSDILRENWKHQLGKYKITSFYEGIGNLVPRDSALFHLPGDHENAIKLDAKHRDMCRFDPSNEQDKNNYFLVEGNLIEMCEVASKQADRNIEMDYLDFWRRRNLNVQNPRFRDIMEPHAKSFEWIWIEDSTGPGFVDWLRNGKGLFWISGKPGSGKSTLMKHVFESPRTSSFLSNNPRSPVRMLRYFFHELGQAPEKQFRGFLSSVLFQLIDAFPDIAAQAVPVFKQECDSEKPAAGWICSETGLREVFRQINKNIQTRRTVCLFLDGLDECEGNQREHIKFLTSWLTNGGPLDLKICLASRPVLEIDTQLSRYPGFKIHEWTANDIGFYARDRLNESAISLWAHCDGYQRQVIIRDIIRRASGVFLWVKIVVDELIIGLEEGDYPSELQKRLDALPPNLEDLYTRILTKIPVYNLHDTINYFSLLMAEEIGEFQRYGFGFVLFTLATRDPLEALKIPVQADASKKEFEEPCEQMIRRLKSRCRTLIQIGPKVEGTTKGANISQMLETPLFAGSVAFVHRTVEEYISKPETDHYLRSKVDLKLLQDPHVSIMAASLRLLKTAVPWPTWPLEIVSSVVVPFTSASDGSEASTDLVRAFIAQARAAEISTGNAQTEYLDELDKILSKVHRHWARYYYNDRWQMYTSDEIDLLSVAVADGLKLYVKDNLTRTEFTLRRKSARPLLLCAFDGAIAIGMEQVNSDIISLLLENGAQPNEVWEGVSVWESAIKCRAEARYFAIGQWCEAFMHMLQHGADATKIVDTQDGLSTALSISILQLMDIEAHGMPMHKGWELIRKFLEYGANPDEKDSKGVSAKDIARREDCNPIVLKIISEVEPLSPSSLSKRRQSKMSIEGERENSSTGW